MLKIFLTALVSLIGVYWLGDKVRRNPKIDKFISAIEGRYSKINGLLAETTVREGLGTLQRIYGWTSIGFFCISFANIYILKPKPSATLASFSAFSIFFLGWFSIKWSIAHKKTITDIIRSNALMFFGPLLVGVFDLLFGTPFSELIASTIYQSLSRLHVEAPIISNPVYIGGIVSAGFLLLGGIWYILSWFLLAPAFFLSVALVVFPCRLALLLQKIDKENTFLWFTIFVFLAASLGLSQL